MLIGEVPLVGNRLMELAKSYDDTVESILSDERTRFVIPVPSKTVRDVIEANREKTISNPRHEKEAKDAPPNVMRGTWYDLNRLAVRLGMAVDEIEKVPYSPDVYRGVYEYLLKQRHVRVLYIDEVLKPPGSAYDYETAIPELSASPQQVTEIMKRLETDFTVEQIENDVNNWYLV